jgi:threonine/homoserine/homoserine lactone efflux protein
MAVTEILLPLLGFVIVSTTTPGPNNLMVLISGANWGLRPTVPHILGIATGFPVMIVAVGLGLELVFQAFPVLHEILKWVAFAYLCWLAWKIAMAGRPRAGGRSGRPMTFLEAAAFQWVNPNAWAIVLAAVDLYTSDAGNKAVEITVIAVLFGLVCIPNGIVWALFGGAISRGLADDTWRRRFNIGMAILLVVSSAPTLF